MHTDVRQIRRTPGTTFIPSVQRDLYTFDEIHRKTGKETG